MINGSAIRFSKFHDQPHSRIVASRQTPLSARTPRLSNTSFGRRNASHSDSRTSAAIGTMSFQRLPRTLENTALPNSSQPESQTPVFGSADSSVVAVRAAGAFVEE